MMNSAETDEEKLEAAEMLSDAINSNIRRGGGESAAKLNSLPRSSNTHSITQNTQKSQ